MYDIVMLGGDIRQIYMALYLRSLGYSVLTYGLSHSIIQDICKPACSLKEAVLSSNIVIGPIPLSSDNCNIPALTSSSDLNLEDLLKLLHSGQLLFAGMISDSVCLRCKEKQVECYDFMKEDSVAIENGISTAEGAIMEAIAKSKGNMHKAPTLVLGFGRCAKVLAQKLKGLDADVTICARKEADLAYADALGFDFCHLSDLSNQLECFEYIFNSIPTPILTRDLLCLIPKDTTIIDIASPPGGLDYEAARQLGLNYSHSLGIPGKVSPKSSGIILADYVLKKTFCRKKVSP